MLKELRMLGSYGYLDQHWLPLHGVDVATIIMSSKIPLSYLLTQGGGHNFRKSTR